MDTHKDQSKTGEGNASRKIKFQLQASDNTVIGGWQNTKFISVYLPEVEREFVKLANDPTRWIGGKIGQLRIAEVHSDRCRCDRCLKQEVA